MTRLSTAQIKALIKTTGQVLPDGFLEEGRPTETEAILELPIPPTTNHLFITVRGRRIVSPDYTVWRTEAGKKLQGQSPAHIVGPVHLKLTIHGGKGFPVNRDLDNCFKAVLDLLVTHNVVEADDIRIVRSVYAEYLAPINRKAEARCTVSLKSVS